MALYLRQRRKHNQERGVQPLNGGTEVKPGLRIRPFLLERPTYKLGQLRNKLLCLRRLGQPDKVQGKDSRMGRKETNEVLRIFDVKHGFELRRKRNAHRIYPKRHIYGLGGSAVHQRIQQRDDAGRRQNPDGEGDEYRRSASYKRRQECEVYV